MKRIILLMLCIGLNTSLFGQNLQDYEFIRVPVKFDFLKEENQYQLNALTAFLFEKKGFQVLYRDDIPKNIDPCNVLQANVHSDSGFLRTRLYFTLENCKEAIVFTSETGISREKDFKLSYHEALRAAFASIEPVRTNMTTNENIIKEDSVVTIEETERRKEIVIDPVVTANDLEVIEDNKKTAEANGASGQTFKERRYINGPSKYILKNTSTGFDLFKAGSEEKFARLVKSGGGDTYLYSSENFSGSAFFDASGNLVVEYLEPSSQQLISVIYKTEDQ